MNHPADPPADLPGQGQSAPTERRLVTRRTTVRRPLGGGFWLTAVVVLAALVALVSLTQRAGAEDALAGSVRDALRAQGLGKVTVAVEGRDVTAGVPAGADVDKAERTASAVSGVATVTTRTAFASAAQRRTCAALDKELDTATGGQQILFVPGTTRLTSEGARRADAAATVLKRCPIGDVVVGGHADDDTADGATLSLERARVLVARLAGKGVQRSRLEARGYGDQFAADADGAAARNERGSISTGGS